MNDTSFDILLGLLHGPSHGYALLKHIEVLHDNRYSPGPGLLYTTLKKLLDQELIQTAGVLGTQKLYELTDAGRGALQQEMSNKASYWTNVESVASSEKGAKA